MIYGDYVSKDKFGPNACVFSEIPALYFDSNTCTTIYKFLKSHIQKNERVLIELEYGNLLSNTKKYTIEYNHMIKKDI